MKRSMIIISTLLFLISPGSSARAVTWTFDFESLDESQDIWGPESPPVETGAIEYDYQWEITQADIKLEGGDILPEQDVWIPILSNLPVDVQNGLGTKDMLPFQIGPININDTGINADLFLAALADGQGSGVLSNITFGTNDIYDVAGIRVSGDFTVTPEPASVALLSAGMLLVFRMRRSCKI